MNHAHLPLGRPTQAHSGWHPGNHTRHAALRRLPGILIVGGAIPILVWTLFSQDIMAGACKLYEPGCIPPIFACRTTDGEPGLRLGNGPCVPTPGPLCGAVHPKYLILTVIYVPPGKKGPGDTSSIKYTQSSTSGNSLSVSDSFKEESKTSYSETASIPIGSVGSLDLGLGFSASTSRNQRDASKADFKTTITMSREIPGPQVDGITHDEDRIYLLLNPKVNLCLTQSGNQVQWSLGHSAQFPDVQFLTVAELNGSAKIPEDVAAHVRDLTSADFREILLKAHPLAMGPTARDTICLATDVQTRCRYIVVDSVPYRPGGSGKETFTQETRREKIGCRSQETSQSSGLSVSGSAEFLKAFKLSVKQEDTWTFTRSSETCTSSSTLQSAELKLVAPSAEYRGPPVIGIVYDVLYQTFAFVPVAPGGRIAVAGTVRDESGRPAPGREVLLYANGTQYRTFTDEEGRYEFSGDFAGRMEVATRGSPKQLVPQVDGTAIVDFIRPVDIPLPLHPVPWVVPHGRDMPDLLPVGPEPVAFPFCGRGNQVVVRVRNVGGVAAVGSITTVGFGELGSFDIATPEVPADSFVDLAPVAIPPGCFNPDCGFGIVVDSRNDVDEGVDGEANNTINGQCPG